MVLGIPREGRPKRQKLLTFAYAHTFFEWELLIMPPSDITFAPPIELADLIEQGEKEKS
jgi:hypothetical protein